MLSAIRDDNPVLFFEPMALATRRADRSFLRTTGCRSLFAHRAPGTRCHRRRRGIDGQRKLARGRLPGDGRHLYRGDRRALHPAARHAAHCRVGAAHRATGDGARSMGDRRARAEIVAAVAEADPAVLRAPVQRVGTAPVPRQAARCEPTRCRIPRPSSPRCDGQSAE